MRFSIHDGVLRARVAYGSLAVLASIAGVGLCARLTFAFPGASVPQSAQTFAVILFALVLGSRVSVVAMSGYVALGIIGVPVFAGGESGWATAVGPSLGYLVGFVIAGATLTAIEKSCLRWGRWRFLAAALAGHVVILSLGWLRLSLLIGGQMAWQSGVVPFLVGAVVKSAAAAALSAAMDHWGRPIPVFAARLQSPHSSANEPL